MSKNQKTKIKDQDKENWFDVSISFADVPIERFNTYCFKLDGDEYDRWHVGCEDWDDEQSKSKALVSIYLTTDQIRKLLTTMTSQMMEKKEKPKRAR